MGGGVTKGKRGNWPGTVGIEEERGLPFEESWKKERLTSKSRMQKSRRRERTRKKGGERRILELALQCKILAHVYNG